MRAVHIAPALVDAGRVRTAPVTRRRPTGALRLPADVVATPEGAAEAGTLLAGRVARFESREGDHVRRGQVLAWLDAPEAARAVADFVRARTRTQTLARKVTRLEGLVASEAATRAVLDEARLELDLARADLSAARTFLGSLGVAEPAEAPEGKAPSLPAQLPVRSPVDGVVVERNAALGAHVTPETRLFRLVSEGRVLVEARIADGADVVLTSSDLAHVQRRGGERCPARVLGVLPQVETSTRSRKVRLAPDVACVGLAPGAQVEVEIAVPARASPDGGADDVLVLPAAAALEIKSTTIVFVKGAEAGAFEVRPIEPGLRIGGDLVVGAGVAEGEEVAVEGAILLKGELMRSELGGEE
ncbi:MAG: efflux RND transporter periplasmic adaptor subunit [Labilithrix sp.]|nr:efflux RND transporter periplasmic adaptor subunit [Labilithrix sp.]MBX3221326.1 efflux RND transporter periplasmic adaptor subunit [Labilithrix sp.]